MQGIESTEVDTPDPTFPHKSFMYRRENEILRNAYKRSRRSVAPEKQRKRRTETCRQLQNGEQ